VDLTGLDWAKVKYGRDAFLGSNVEGMKLILGADGPGQTFIREESLVPFFEETERNRFEVMVQGATYRCGCDMFWLWKGQEKYLPHIFSPNTVKCDDEQEFFNLEETYFAKCA